MINIPNTPKSADLGQLKYSPADARHFGVVNAAFLDGHAEARKYEDLGYELDPATKRPVEKGLNDIGDPGNNRLWTGTGRDEPSI